MPEYALVYGQAFPDSVFSRNLRKDLYASATQREIAEYSFLSATLMYLGTSVIHPASLATSLMQQRINCLQFIHIVEENAILKDRMCLEPLLRFPAVKDGETTIMIVSFSDTAHGGK